MGFGETGIRNGVLYGASPFVSLYPGLSISRAQAHLVVPCGGKFGRNLSSLRDLGFADLIGKEEDSEKDRDSRHFGVGLISTSKRCTWQ